jgi:hypothetical protein
VHGLLGQEQQGGRPDVAARSPSAPAAVPAEARPLRREGAASAGVVMAGSAERSTALVERVLVIVL